MSSNTNQVFRSIQLIGGNNPVPNVFQFRPDLDVEGGIRVKQTADIRKLSTKEIEARNITELKDGEGVLIDKPLFYNPYGIARAYLDDKYIFFDDDDAILDEEDWITTFETGNGPSLLKQEGHLFKVPEADEMIHPMLLNDNWVAIVEVRASLMFLVDHFGIEAEQFIAELKLLKNESTFRTSYHNSVGINSITPQTITFHDIIKCEPGDVLDFEFETFGDGDTKIQDGEEISYVTFKILGFEKQIIV